MPLTIPREYAKGLAALNDLTDAEVSVFAGALATLPNTIRQRKEIISFLKTSVGESLSKIDELVRSLLSLYQARGTSEATLGSFVNDLADAVMASGMPEFALDEAGRVRFIDNMRLLLGVESLVFLAKANALQRDHERLFHGAKILTDLRPVFRTADEEPTDMIVEYTLKLVFHDGSRRHRELYMVLDERDMSALRESIDRAEKKAASLKSLCKSKSIEILPSLSEA
jgi:hypothetical protein